MSAGRTLARITVAPALLTIAWLMVALPLLFAGEFNPGTAITFFIPVAAIVLALGFHGSTRPNALALSADQKVSWWVVAGVGAVAIAFFVLQLAMCSEQIIVRRDPASYVQFATWLTGHGSLPIPEMKWAFGGGDPALAYESPAFYQTADGLVPQFMAGLPMILALGGWIGGTNAMLAMGPLLGACAVLSFGGLTARLAGPRWAPAGALALALTLPMMYVSRGTFSEAAALVLLLGGLALLHDVRDLRPSGQTVPPWKQPVRVRAFLAGLALGLVVLVRIDGLRDILPVVFFAGLLIARRRRTGWPLAAGLVLGAGAGLLEGYTLSRPYLSYLSRSLNPLLVLTAAVVAGTVVMVVLMRLGPVRRRLRRAGMWVSSGRLPDVAALLTLLVMIGFAIRPYVQTVIRIPVREDDKLNDAFIKYAQQANGLAVEFGRQYSEISFYWVIWYVGVPAVLLAVFGASMLSRRMLRRESPEWLLPFMVVAWTTVTTLWRPGITPDHPWASRRLITIVIPGMLLLALWGLAWLVRSVRQRARAERPSGQQAGDQGADRSEPKTGPADTVTDFNAEAIADPADAGHDADADPASPVLPSTAAVTVADAKPVAASLPPARSASPVRSGPPRRPSSPRRSDSPRRSSRAARVESVVVAGLGTVAVIAPIAVTSSALMFTKIEQDQVAAVRKLCTKLGNGRSVVIVDRVTADRFSQVIRGMCGVPTARAASTLLSPWKVPAKSDIQRVIGKIQKAERRAVILGLSKDAVAPYGPPQQVMSIVTKQEEHSLVSAPDGTWRLTFTMWMAEPPAPY